MSKKDDKPKLVPFKQVMYEIKRDFRKASKNSKPRK